MYGTRIAIGVAATALLLTCGTREARAAAITITAAVSDRGQDVFPWDGVGATVFNNPSVVQITTPPLGTLMATEERTAVEFPIGAIPAGSTIDSVTLRLTPVGSNANIGLSAGEVSELHGYAGDGVIQVTDLSDSTAVGSIAGPTADGPVMVLLSASWLQALVNGASPFAGLMFKGVPGPVAVTYTFDSAFGSVPAAERPTLLVEYSTTDAIPEPSIVLLFFTGVAWAARHWRTAR
jgi:hypothetical protein